MAEEPESIKPSHIAAAQLKVAIAERRGEKVPAWVSELAARDLTAEPAGVGFVPLPTGDAWQDQPDAAQNNIRALRQAYEEDLNKAEALARSITDPDQQARALAAVAEAVATTAARRVP
jgi:hypothetical protein